MKKSQKIVLAAFAVILILGFIEAFFLIKRVSAIETSNTALQILLAAIMAVACSSLCNDIIFFLSDSSKKTEIGYAFHIMFAFLSSVILFAGYPLFLREVEIINYFFGALVLYFMLGASLAALLPARLLYFFVWNYQRVPSGRRRRNEKNYKKGAYNENNQNRLYRYFNRRFDFNSCGVPYLLHNENTNSGQS